MGVPLFPLAAAYGLGLGHLAGNAFYNRYMSAPANNQLQTWNHPSRTITIKGSGARTSTKQTMKRSRSRTKTRGKKRRMGRLRRRIPRALVPSSKIVRLRAVDTVAHDFSASANLQGLAYSMFNILDPWGTHGSAQPLGLDQLSALYRRAVVVGCKIIVRVHNQSNVAMVVGITPMKESQGTTLLSGAEHYMEVAATKSRVLSPEMDHGILGHRIGTRKWVGVTNLKDESAFHCDLVSVTSPTRDAYWHVWGQPLNGGVTPTDGTDRLEYLITSEFLVRLWDPIVPSRS